MIKINALKSQISSLRMQLSGALAQRLLMGATWSILGGVIASASSLFSAILVARMLGPEKYGALGLIQSTLNTFIIIVAPAVGLTATKFIAELREHNPVRAGNILGLTMVSAYVLSGFMALLMVGGARYLAESMCKAPYLAPLLQISAIALFFSAVSGAQSGALAGVEAFRSIAIANLVKGVVTLPAMWFGTQLDGIRGAVISLAVTAFIGSVVSQWLLSRALRRAGIQIRYKGMWGHSRLLLTFSLPAMLTSGMVLVAMWLGNVILVRQVNGYAAFGVFNAANQWRAAILFLPNMIVQPFLPILANLAGKGLMNQYKKTLAFSIVGSTLVALVPSIIILLLSGSIMAAYGTAFAGAKWTLILVVLATLVAAPTIAIIQAMNALGDLWASACIHFIWIGVFLLTLIGMVHAGANGLGSAYLVSYLVQFFFFVGYIRWRIKGIPMDTRAEAVAGFPPLGR